MTQNRSHAVMAQRHEAMDSLDDFPTPPWATRALCEHVLDLTGARVWEPACNRGYMARPLAEYAGEVVASDVMDYGSGQVFDFLSAGDMLGDRLPFGRVDWVITNPPFRLVDDFLRVALAVADRGVALLGRTMLLEGGARYQSIWSKGSASWAQYVERVPMIKGRVDRKASTATAYGWLIIDKTRPRPGLVHIPPCRARLERDGDYPVAA